MAYKTAMRSPRPRATAPAARGGACKAELVISDERIDYVKADVLDAFVSFNKQSFDKFKGDVNPNTRLFLDSTFITNEEDAATCSAGTVYMFPATQLAEENFGTAVCSNIVMMASSWPRAARSPWRTPRRPSRRL